MSYPRREQYRLIAAGVGWLMLAMFTVGVALDLLVDGNGTVALVLVGTAGALGLTGRRSLGLAAQNRVGADSEHAVRRQLDALRADGWDVRHSVRWRGGGDVDHLLRSPAGVGFAVETKTSGFNDEHLQRTLRSARWAAGNGRRFRHGVIPVVCVVRSRHVEHFYGEVLVVSLDRLSVALCSRAGSRTWASASGCRSGLATTSTATRSSPCGGTSRARRRR